MVTTTVQIIILVERTEFACIKIGKCSPQKAYISIHSDTQQVYTAKHIKTKIKYNININQGFNFKNRYEKQHCNEISEHIRVYRPT